MTGAAAYLLAKNAKGGGDTPTSYTDLEDKPTLNGITINGNMASEDLGLIGDDSDLTEEQLEDLLALL